MLLKSKLMLDGNLSYANLFNFYISLVMGKQHRKMMEKQKRRDREERLREHPSSRDELARELKQRGRERLRAEQTDPGVKYLEDPYLSRYGLNDFPRLKRFLDIHFETRPQICHERPLLLTEWFEANGFETDREGKPWVSELRQARAFKHLMENRKPIIRPGDLIAGTTTTREIGVVIYPDTHGTMIWGELHSAPDRLLNPYDISPETVQALHRHVFPFWIHRNTREWVRENYGYPLSQRLDERFAVYFMWKTAALSHTIADFPKLLRLGTDGIIAEIRQELARDSGADQRKQDTLEAMIICLEGLAAYAGNLSVQAARRPRRRETRAVKLSSSGWPPSARACRGARPRPWTRP